MKDAATASRAERAARLRVAFLVHRFPVISETFVATLAAEIKARVGAFRLLATDGEVAAPPHHPVVERAGLLDDLHVAARRGRMEPAVMARLARAQPRKAGYLAGLAALDLAAPRHLLALTRMMSRQPQFDILHCQFGYEGFAALRHQTYGTLRTRALVVHLRGSDVTRHVREKGRGVYDEMFRRADLFIANCDYFRRTAIELGCPPEKVVVVGSPIDTDLFVPPREREAPGDRPLRLVAVGRLVDKKGFGDAIEAMARRGGLDARLDIFGDGPLRPELEARVAELGLDDRVVLHGAADQTRVIAALHAADIALAPSVTAPSGDADAPVNTLKEAMATALPVIATRHGGIPELVRPGESGALVDERDPDGLAAAIRDLAARPDDWPRLGANGRHKVVTDYGLVPVAERTLDAYLYALDRSKTPTP